MKYFEFGQEHPDLMVMLHGVSYGTFILMDVLADDRLTITTAIADGMPTMDYADIKSPVLHVSNRPGKNLRVRPRHECGGGNARHEPGHEGVF